MIAPFEHIVIAPILLPLFASAVMLVFSERRRWLKRVISLSTASALVIIAAFLVARVSEGDAPLPAYRLGDWPAPFGIVLVVDQLSAIMLLLVSLLGLASLFYALARWDKAGPRFHALFLLLLMGVNGAFLTGDLFNLFVFFEVMLAASYGLALHGVGKRRTMASLHYVTINIATSLLFLIGVALIYSVTGTLNMADLALRVPMLAGRDLVLMESGAAILSLAFFVKAGMWPVGFWLIPTYGAATAPVAAVFAIMSKVGIYSLLRLSALAFGPLAGMAEGFASSWILIAGFATLLFGTLTMLAASRLTTIAGAYVMISSGTLLATIGTGSTVTLAGALFYLVSSTLGVSAMYLLIEPVERAANSGAEGGQQVEPVFEDDEPDPFLTQEDEIDAEDEIGVVIPATIAILGSAFILVSLLMAGLPPLSGFLAKFAIIGGLLQSEPIPLWNWFVIALIILSGLATLIAMTRAGITLLWAPAERPRVHLHLLEALPIGVLLMLCAALVVLAGPATSYMSVTARALHDPSLYVAAVMSQSMEAVEEPSR